MIKDIRELEATIEYTQRLTFEGFIALHGKEYYGHPNLLNYEDYKFVPSVHGMMMITPVGKTTHHHTWLHKDWLENKAKLARLRNKIAQNDWT